MQRIVQAGVAGMLMALGAATSVFAQTQARSRVIAGGDLFYARPQGEFLRSVKRGFGGGGNVVFPLGDGILGLRIDLGYIGYGRDTREVLVYIPPYSYPVNQTTTNNILTVGVGPQFMATSGPIRPYLNVTGGFTRFYTQSTLDDLDSDIFETTSTRSDDWKLSYSAGGGFYIPLSQGRTPVMLNLGASFHENGRATYLTKDDITIDQNTQVITITPRRSDVRFATYQLGITVGF